MNDELKTLDTIETEMKELEKESDLEASYGSAEDLLGDLIRTLATGTENEEQARRIWNTYCTLDKWYA